MNPPASNGTPELAGTVLVIDDSPEILGIVNELVKQDYRLKAANSGEKGLRLAAGCAQGVCGYAIWSARSPTASAYNSDLFHRMMMSKFL